MIAEPATVKAESTGPQLQVAALTDPKLPKPQGVTYRQLRVIRLHPTVALCRLLISSPIIAANWSFEKKDDDVPDEWVELIEECIYPIRDNFLETAVLGMVDFGWQGFEVVWGFNRESKVIVEKLKSLLQDSTTILVDQSTGAFRGFLQSPSGNDVYVLDDKALLLNIEVEGTNWYGRGRLSSAYGPVLSWEGTNNGAEEYDTKVAGSHWMIKYPPGKTPYGSAGVETENYDIAVAILNQMKSSGKIIVPAAVSGFIKDANGRSEQDQGWDISIISDGSARQYSYTNRLEYQDKLIVRAMGLLERAVLEASMGTRADAGTHSQTGATVFDLMHRGICNNLNQEVVDRCLVTNFGEGSEGSVYISPAPITDVSLSFLQEIYQEFLKDANIRATEYDDLNIAALRDKVNVPHDGDLLEGDGNESSSSTSVSVPGDTGDGDGTDPDAGTTVDAGE